MDPDGIRYFGGTAANATGPQFSMTTCTNPEWSLKNPVTPGTIMGGHQQMEMWQTGVAGTDNMMGGQSHMSSYRAVAPETLTTPAGTFANVLHVMSSVVRATRVTCRTDPAFAW
jgi:hypothetical protein